MRYKTFQLMNHKIKVKYQKTVNANDGQSCYGTCNPEMNLIKVATHSPSTGEPLDPDFIEHSFHHELAHMLMALMSRNELYGDEPFVDTLGALIAQFNKTKK